MSWEIWGRCGGYMRGGIHKGDIGELGCLEKLLRVRVGVRVTVRVRVWVKVGVSARVRVRVRVRVRAIGLGLGLGLGFGARFVGPPPTAAGPRATARYGGDVVEIHGEIQWRSRGDIEGM